MSRLDDYLADPMLFRREQIVLDGGGALLGEVIEPWQEENIFGPLDERQADGRYKHRLAYLELPRGHAKTTMVASEAVTQLVFGGPDWRGHIAAGDKDQARELFHAAARFIQRNPNLEGDFSIQRDRIVAKATGASLRVHSSDAPTAHGLQVDWFAIDEFWNQPSRDLWDAFYTASVKRPNWRGIVMTTAGYDKQTICWEVREIAQRRDDFYFFSAPGRLAGWITDEEIDRQRETLPAHIFQRLHENKWVEGAGSFVTRAALARCFDDRFRQEPHGWRGRSYVLAVDLGLTKDRTAMAIMHREDDLYVLDDMQVWQGSQGEPVQIAEVEAAIASASTRFHLARIVCDPWQMQRTIQRFGGLVEEFRFNAASVARLSATLLHLVTTGRLRMYPDDDLFRELAELQAEQTSYGWRIDHARNKHDDRAMAMGMAALLLRDETRFTGRSRMSRARFSVPGWMATGDRVGGTAAYVNREGQVEWRPITSGDRRLPFDPDPLRTRRFGNREEHI